MDEGRTSGGGGLHQRFGGDYPTSNTGHEELAHRDVHRPVGQRQWQEETGHQSHCHRFVYNLYNSSVLINICVYRIQ